MQSNTPSSEIPVAVLVDGRLGSWMPVSETAAPPALVPLPVAAPPGVQAFSAARAATLPFGDEVFAAVAPVFAPQTAANSAVLESCAEACAAVHTEACICGVIVVPSDPAALPEPFTVDGVDASHAPLALAVAGTPPFACPTTQTELLRPPVPEPFPSASDAAEPPTTDGPPPQTDETSAVGVPLVSLACARKQNEAVVSAELGSLTVPPALAPDVRRARV
jgi:hypothetical protein